MDTPRDHQFTQASYGWARFPGVSSTGVSLGRIGPDQLKDPGSGNLTGTYRPLGLLGWNDGTSTLGWNRDLDSLNLTAWLEPTLTAWLEPDLDSLAGTGTLTAELGWNRDLHLGWNRTLTFWNRDLGWNRDLDCLAGTGTCLAGTDRSRTILLAGTGNREPGPSQLGWNRGTGTLTAWLEP